MIGGGDFMQSASCQSAMKRCVHLPNAAGNNFF